MRTKSIRAHQGLTDDPLWYKDAIIYQIRTRSFFDANGDGLGDFAGLAQKLDYIEDLGVTALWLLPFYPSPGRDDGYDIADYTAVHADVGTLDDFRRFLDEAHRRGLRVITELVINHTSDQHPWFQRARRAPPGSAERDFYVWSDTQDRYRDTRIIFKDFEPSNWSWDPIAKAYFWHRFYAHQPDLNFDNPAVHEAVFEAMDFWFSMGVDGLRLDAIPYLYEREGTNCENLPETHAFLKKLRARIDERYPNRMVLAEANQWPEDAAAYFGAGDECHMNFHFPIMPRLYMAMHMEDRFPIVDILAQTPAIPATCQWAMFLRNHDELTLEMVTDEERDYMYRAYAEDPQARINLGIRRRLAPLCGNDRRKMELLNALLHSLPGTPVLYYGDEIGMGDNVFLGDRNGVRTPMQWSADRNAGFSRVNPQRLVLPIIIDPDYHYESINVEAQQNASASLLWWTKRIVALRKRHQAFGRGTLELLHPENPRVLAFVREHEGAAILVVANLSRHVQVVELDLGRFRGARPVEMFGRTKFPPVGDRPTMITLSPYGFYWLELVPEELDETAQRRSTYGPPLVECTGLDALLFGEERELLEQALPEFLATRRWLDAPGRALTHVAVAESISLDATSAILLVRALFAEGEPATYVLPVAFVPDDEAARRVPGGVVAQIRVAHGPAGGAGDRWGWLVDALEDPAHARVFYAAVARGARFSGLVGDARAQAASALPDEAPEPRVLSGEHRSAALAFGERHVLKVFRRMEGGASPELEVGRWLARASGEAAITPRVAGWIEYAPAPVGRARPEPVTLAVLEDYVANEGTAWTHARAEVRRFFERVLTTHREGAGPPRAARSCLSAARAEVPRELAEVVGGYAASAERLGRRTAELHLALAGPPANDDPAFAPEAYSTFDQRSKYQSLRNLVGLVARALRAPGAVPEVVAAEARAVLDGEGALLRRFEPLLSRRLTARRIRIHGDYHLGQVLHTGRDFVVIDFEGDPALPYVERRRKRSALRDVAGMLLSFQYAAYTVLFDEAHVRASDRPFATPWAHAWHAGVGASFLRAYLARAAADGRPTFLPEGDDELELLLDAALTDAAFHAIRKELARDKESPRGGVKIPLLGLGVALGAPHRGG